jgi:hypothetical protein
MVYACVSAYMHAPACVQAHPPMHTHTHRGTKSPDSDLAPFNTFHKIKMPNKTWINSQIILESCINWWGYVISYSFIVLIL